MQSIESHKPFEELVTGELVSYELIDKGTVLTKFCRVLFFFISSQTAYAGDVWAKSEARELFGSPLYLHMCDILCPDRREEGAQDRRILFQCLEGKSNRLHPAPVL